MSVSVIGLLAAPGLLSGAAGALLAAAGLLAAGAALLAAMAGALVAAAGALVAAAGALLVAPVLLLDEQAASATIAKAAVPAATVLEAMRTVERAPADRGLGTSWE
ncbi:MAG TPA: hypothetical protein VGL75_16440 [Acidothermaceae bacterium]